MIHRADHKKNYLLVNNDTIRDSRLSFEARGLLVFMLTMNDQYEFSCRGLAFATGMNKNTINRITQELQQFGYIEFIDSRSKTGKFGSCEWVVHEKPCPVSADTVPCPKKPCTVKPCPVKRDGKEIPIERKTNIKNNQKKDKKEKVEQFSELIEPLSPELKETFYEFIEMRKAIKAPLTQKALDLAIKKAFKLADGDEQKVKAIVEQSITNSWRGFFPLKEDHTAPTAIPKTNRFGIDVQSVRAFAQEIDKKQAAGTFNADDYFKKLAAGGDK